jgi:hypothetical protein
MAPQYALPTRLRDSIVFLWPWAHGQQRKAIGDFVAALMEPQTAGQAQVARYCGNQEAAVKRFARLRHPERLAPRRWAEAVLFQALPQCPQHGQGRLAMAWTMAADQPWLVVSLVVGRRAVPVDWRAYAASVFTGRRKRSALAVIRRAVGRGAQAVGNRRVIVTADRGCADVALCTFLSQLGVTCSIRVQAGTHVACQGQWSTLGPGRLRGQARHRRCGARPSCERGPPRFWGAQSRARDAKGNGGLGHVVSQRPWAAPAAAHAYGPRVGGAEGLRATKGWRGCAKARMAQSKAWARMLALFAIALLGRTSLGSKL